MRITLTVVRGPFQGRAFTFTGHDTFLLGRSKHVHFRLPPSDRFCSRFHFLVEVNPPHCRLLDLGSNNGTFVNGTKVQAAELKDGDKIAAGKSVLRLAIETADDLTADVQSPLPPCDATPAPPKPAPPPATAAPPAVTVSYHAPACAVCAAPVTVPPLCPECWEQSRRQVQDIPRYLLVRKLGQGGMGVVYLAVQEADRAVVALKTILPAATGTPGQVERFLREANILRELKHPRIVAFRDMGEVKGKLYFAMDYVSGRNGVELVKRDGPLAVPRAAVLAGQLLEALEYAHGRGFVHRDVKPANLLATRTAAGEEARLADFGLARIYQSSNMSGLTMTGDMGGTPAFMAPEQILNFRDSPPSVDQYAASATLYYLLTGKYVFDLPRDAQEAFGVVLQADPVPIRQRRPDVPEGLARVIHKGLAREPGKRFADVGAMRRAMAAVRT